MRIVFFIAPLLIYMPFIYFLPCYRISRTYPLSAGKEVSLSRALPVQRSHAMMNRSASSVSRYQIIITEVMADPSPPAKLPEYEYIELKNNSSQPIDLKGFKLGDGNSTASFQTSIVLAPDSFLICCSNTAAAQLSAYGRCMGLSNFPSLANESDVVQLISPQGQIIHSVSYQAGWHRNHIKAEGGWSLEMINTASPCAGSSNWASSLSAAGGTPGRANSHPPGEGDHHPPSLLHTYPVNTTTLVAVFDEPLDSNSAAQPKHYRLSALTISPVKCEALPPAFHSVQLTFQQPLAANTVYELVVQQVKDCAGNTIGAQHSAKAGLAAAASPGDIVINEILFDPPPEGADYVELFNRSRKIIDLQSLFCSNRQDAGTLINSKRVSPTPYLLFPGEYLVLTEDPDWVQQQFKIRDTRALQSAMLPSLPNDKGHLVLSDATGVELDALQYTADWHFPLLASPESVSLERIDPGLLTQDRHNWHSASASAGGGTPGYVNSQYKTEAADHMQFQLSSSLFSPGRDDLLLIRYQSMLPGTAGTVQIFDLDGKPVRQLSSNALMGARGHWAWDGLNEAKQPLPSGIYIVQVSWFNQQGRTGRWKKAVAMVRM